jgi:hypothetical protein
MVKHVQPRNDIVENDGSQALLIGTGAAREKIPNLPAAGGRIEMHADFRFATAAHFGLPARDQWRDEPAMDRYSFAGLSIRFWPIGAGSTSLVEASLEARAFSPGFFLIYF